MNNLREVTEFLFSHRADGLPTRALAEVFDRLIWCVNDNGKEMLEIQSEWLMSENLERIAIALEMDEACPFKHREQMNDVLRSIVEKWPELKTKCDKFAANWEHLS